MKLIITGSRNLKDHSLIPKAIKYAGIDRNTITEVVSGKALGIDTLGENWAKFYGIPVKEFPAEWENLKAKGVRIKTRPDGTKYNILAGFQRNQKMADYADALLAIEEFPSAGTEDMIERAKAKGLKVWVYEI